MVGARTRHGPHHSAQKSTKTGTDDWSTSCSKLESVTATVFPMANPPSGYLRSGCPLVDVRGNDSMHKRCRGSEHRGAVPKGSNRREPEACCDQTPGLAARAGFGP